MSRVDTAWLRMDSSNLMIVGVWMLGLAYRMRIYVNVLKTVCFNLNASNSVVEDTVGATAMMIVLI
jgi:uncharacterized membrane protein